MSYEKIYRGGVFACHGIFPATDALISRATINSEFLVPLSPVRAIELAPLASSSISASRTRLACLPPSLPSFSPSYPRRFSAPSWQRVNEIGRGHFKRTEHRCAPGEVGAPFNYSGAINTSIGPLHLAAVFRQICTFVRWRGQASALNISLSLSSSLGIHL